MIDDTHVFVLFNRLSLILQPVISKALNFAQLSCLQWFEQIEPGHDLGGFGLH